MVILGLGSNVSDRLQYLRKALQLIKKIPQLEVTQVSPVYISDALLLPNSPPSWDMPYLNLALRCETQQTPLALLQLLKQIEQDIGRKPGEEWGPRPIDIDILAWDDLIQYDEKLHVPHEHLHERPFALWPLADVAPHWIYPLPNEHQGKTATEIASQWGSRFTGEAPLHTKQILQRIDTPQLVGIINLTPDSFSDGGALTTTIAAIRQARSLIDAGAEIIDIGAEATGPNAIAVHPTEEWRRLEPVLIGILAEIKTMLIPPKISVDTRHAETAKKALTLGVDWINDVSGLSDPAMCEVVKNNQCDVVIMHQLGVPVDKNRVLPIQEDPVSLVYQWAEKQIQHLEKQGINRQRLIVDIGIGFGKTAEQSLALIKNINQFHQLGIRLLVGHSRKSFLNLYTDKSAGERDVETLLISLYLSHQHIDYLRIHNVEMCARGLRVERSLR